MQHKVIVSGATVSSSTVDPHDPTRMNGIYIEDGVMNGLPRFVQTRGGGGWVVQFVGVRANQADEPFWAICSDDGVRRWVSKEKGNTPPATGWYSGVQWGTMGKFTVQFKVDESHKRSRSVVEAAEQLWKRRKFADATVVCDGKSFDVHRGMLSVQSAVFEAAFESQMKEGQTATYEIKGSTPCSVEAMLKFMYTGEADFPLAELVPLLDLAVQYELITLRDAVADSLLQGVSPENVRSRVRALEVHSANLGAAWEKIIDMVQADRTLLIAMCRN